MKPALSVEAATWLFGPVWGPLLIPLEITAKQRTMVAQTGGVDL